MLHWFFLSLFEVYQGSSSFTLLAGHVRRAALQRLSSYPPILKYLYLILIHLPLHLSSHLLINPNPV